MNPLDNLSEVITSLKNWATRPFQEEMNVLHWFLFTGLILVMVILWTMVLRELKGDI